MTIRLAQLGTWHLHAAHHVEAARAHEATDVVAVWDPRPGEAERFGVEHGLPWFTDLDALLHRADIDGVMVDTETTRHPEVIGAALEAGKHVFSEKVLTVTAADAAHLIELAKGSGLALGVSFPRLSEAAVRTAARLIDDGRLGELTGSRIRYAHHGAVGTPWIPEHFFSLADTGGGALIDLGAHPLYLSMLFHGGAPRSIAASIGYVTGREVEDNATALLDYGNGVLGVIEVSMVASFFAYSLELSGTRGSIAIGPAGQNLLLREGQAGEWIEQPLDPAVSEPFDQWVETVVSGTVDSEHLRVAFDVTRLIEAGYESARTGHTVLLEDA